MVNFFPINYEICNYCRHIGLYLGKEDYETVCSLDIDKEGRCKQVLIGGKISTLSGDIFVIDSNKGCEKFEPSGLPAHPSVIDKLIAKNPLAKNIPSDSEAIETSYDFSDKMVKFPHVRCDYMLRVEK
jgi:hypothetical protein